MAIRLRVTHLLILVLLAGSLTTHVFAQTDLGAVKGHVQDQKGMAITGATVTLRNPATAFERMVKADSGGNFSFTGIPLTGQYTVAVTAPQFKAVQWENVLLRAGTTATVDFTLDISGAKTEINVYGTTETLPTESNQVSMRLDLQKIQDTPYSSFDVRNSFNLSAITNLPYGFKFNPIVFVRSGLPYTPIIGFDTQNDGNDWNDRAIVNGKVAPRNIFRQPSFFDWDIRFVKDITLRGEGHHLDLFLDIFNITGAGNRNFGPAAISLFGTTSAPIFTAGQALFAPDTSHFGSARQVQFTARITAF
jgi:Carboxypeptidase regulatory-like domain